ncbi:hypothetical protein RDI58_022167 [Solanum bulbocastanum]|uniref:DUF1985 domain-containing protein n=1 Tax=Solanum bulbocastanum TaxID=147425 RepID=A0AAN8Y7U4_SOLBU
MKLFKDIIFSPYLNIPKCNYQGQITKCLYLLEVKQDNLDKEIHIRHAKGNVLQFSIKEFAIITGLKCTGNIKDLTYPDSKISRLVQRYFFDPNYNVNKGRLIDRFIQGGWDNTDDALQMTILHFTHSFVYSQLGGAAIPIEDFFMVEDGSYEQYLWGQLAFTKLMKSFRKKICNWKVMGAKPKFEMFMETIFTENDYFNIQPTLKEIRSLDLLDSSHVPPIQLDSSNVNNEEVQSEEVPGFEDFSSKPLEQLLRRST